jgi:hypothetical protein
MVVVVLLVAAIPPMRNWSARSSGVALLVSPASPGVVDDRRS